VNIRQQLGVWRDDPAGLVTLLGLYTVYGGGQQPNQQTSAPSNVLTTNFAVTQAGKATEAKKTDV